MADHDFNPNRRDVRLDAPAPRVRRPRSFTQSAQRKLTIEPMESRLMLSGTDIDTSLFNTDSFAPDYAVITAADFVSTAGGTNSTVPKGAIESLVTGRDTLVDAASSQSLSPTIDGSWQSFYFGLTTDSRNLSSAPAQRDSDLGLFGQSPLLPFTTDLDRFLPREAPEFEPAAAFDLTIHGTAVTGLIAWNAGAELNLTVDRDGDGLTNFSDFAAVVPNRPDGTHRTFVFGLLGNDDRPFVDIPTLPVFGDGNGVSRVDTATVIAAVPNTLPITDALPIGSGFAVPSTSRNTTNSSTDAAVMPAATKQPVADGADTASERSLADVVDELMSQDAIIVVQSTNSTSGNGIADGAESAPPLDSSLASEAANVFADADLPAEGGMISVEAIVSALAGETLAVAQAEGRPMLGDEPDGNEALAETPTEMVGELARAVAFEMIDAEAVPLAAVNAARDPALAPAGGVASLTLARMTASLGVLPLAAVFDGFAGAGEWQLPIDLPAAGLDEWLAGELDFAATGDAAVVDGEPGAARNGELAEFETWAEWRMPKEASALLVVLAMERFVATNRKRDQQAAGRPNSSGRREANSNGSRREGEC